MPETYSVDEAMAALSAMPEQDIASADAVRQGEGTSRTEDLPSAAAADEPDLDLSDAESDEASPEEPSLDPPASYSAADKEAFRELPRVLQEKAIALDKSRRQHLSKTEAELSEARKQLSEQQAALQQERSRIEQHISPLIEQITATINHEFADIKTQSDLDRMAREDPARKVLWDHRQQQFREINAVKQQQIQEQQQKAEQARGQAIEKSFSILQEAIPEWKDVSKAAKDIAEVRSYMRDTYGSTMQEYFGNVESVIASTIDPVSIQVLRKAMAYDRAVAKAKAAKAANSANVPVKPQSRKAVNTDRYGEALSRLSKTGSREDAFAALVALETRIS